MRVVLDTNVLVSAILSHGGPAAQILRLARADRFELVFSPDTIQEHIKVIRYPKIRTLLEKRNLTLNVVEGFLEQLTRISILVSGKTTVDAVKEDPSDNIFLACAMEGDADFVVSGDRHLKELGIFQGIEILAPSEFLQAME